MAPKRKRFEFRILAPEANQVLLSGTFNQWSESTDPMKRDSTGTWKKVKMLLHGQYEYKFIVDGEWMLDPGCSDTVPNRHGTFNNVIEV